MTRAETLDKAKECVCGHREQDYGTPENNFQIIANYWNVYLHSKCKKNPVLGYRLSGEDVAIMMALFKIGRITTGTGTDDSFVDTCGYLACAAECKTGRKPSEEDPGSAIEKDSSNASLEELFETWKGC